MELSLFITFIVGVSNSLFYTESPLTGDLGSIDRLQYSMPPMASSKTVMTPRQVSGLIRGIRLDQCGVGCHIVSQWLESGLRAALYAVNQFLHQDTP
jgi:hypothetical protein